MEDVDGLDTTALDSSLSMLSAFSPWALVGGLFFGIVGIWLFRRGRKTPNLWWVWIGVVMMIYPIFFTAAFATWAVGLALSALAYYKR